MAGIGDVEVPVVRNRESCRTFQMRRRTGKAVAHVFTGARAAITRNRPGATFVRGNESNAVVQRVGDV
jgi:hypothetical protein